MALVALLVPFTLPGFLPVVAPGMLAALAMVWWLGRGAAAAPASPAPAGNPFALLPALGFALLVALVQVAVKWMQLRFGDGGMALTLALAGMLDVDAAIVALRGAPANAISPVLAGAILALPVLLNTLLKLGVVLVTAGLNGKASAAALAAAALAMLAGYGVVATVTGLG